MPSSIVRRPLNLLQFVSKENEQFLISLANNRDELRILSHVQGLYEAVLSNIHGDEDDIVVFQLLAFTHYHFLFSTNCLMRCHLSEAFASARAAIDGALIGAQLIHDRTSQVAYTKRAKPFDNFARHLGNLKKDGKPPPHPLVPTLSGLHSQFSRLASHADVDSFVHRVKISDEPEGRTLSVEYFQFSRDESERKIHALTLFHTFVVILDVFSDFLVIEQTAFPKEWQDELRRLGAMIERTCAELRKTMIEPDAPG